MRIAMSNCNIYFIHKAEVQLNTNRHEDEYMEWR
jgi:hypothetical protein